MEIVTGAMPGLGRDAPSSSDGFVWAGRLRTISMYPGLSSKVTYDDTAYNLVTHR